MPSVNGRSRGLLTRTPSADTVAVVALAAAFSLAACSSGTTAPSGSSTGVPSATTSPATGSSGAPAASGSPSPTSAGRAQAAPSHCTAEQLHFTVGGSQGAAGTVNVTVRVTNTGENACWTVGYPGLQIIDGAGHELSTVVLRGASSPFQGPLPARLRDVAERVTLAPNAWGWFDIAYSDVPQAGLCPTGPAAGTRLAVIAPDTTLPQTISLATRACGGRLGVSPLLPASAWVG